MQTTRMDRLPADDAWCPWTPGEVADRLAKLAVPWHVVGGWALDIWHGRQTRPHSDLEIAVLRTDLPIVRQSFADCRLAVADAGIVSPLADDSEPEPEAHQVWIAELIADCWRLDLMLEPGDREVWVYRRNPILRRDRSLMIDRSDTDIPYLRPEAVLLFKAKALRDKDEADFTASVGLLDYSARDWLRSALNSEHPHHPWIDRLT